MKTRAEVAREPEIAAMRRDVNAAHDRMIELRKVPHTRREMRETEAAYAALSRAYERRVAEAMIADDAAGLSELRAAVEALEPAFALEPC